MYKIVFFTIFIVISLKEKHIFNVLQISVFFIFDKILNTKLMHCF